MPAITICSIARLFGTGKAPGKPRHTGHTFVFGSASWPIRQSQNIFVSSVVSSV